MALSYRRSSGAPLDSIWPVSSCCQRLFRCPVSLTAPVNLTEPVSQSDRVRMRAISLRGALRERDRAPLENSLGKISYESYRKALCGVTPPKAQTELSRRSRKGKQTKKQSKKRGKKQIKKQSKQRSTTQCKRQNT